MVAHRFLGTFLAVSAVAFAAMGPAAHAGDRVVGGTEAKPGSWPFMAYLLIDGAWQCGGTLVAKNVVLTAAHCTKDENDKPFLSATFTVRLGSNDSDSGGILRTVKRVIVHESYNPKTSQNDIALLELDRPVDLPTVSLAGRQPQTRGMVRYSRVSNDAPFGAVVGWGRTDANTQGSVSHNLMEAPIPIIEASACNNVMGKTERGPIDERRICAGLSQGGVDACNGDSGGPLLAPGQDDKWVEVGVTSWGVSRCGDPHTYGVYTRVSAYSDWLARNIGDTQSVTAMADAADQAAALPPKEDGGVLSNAPTVMAVAAREDGKVTVRVCPDAKCPTKGEDAHARSLKVGERFSIQIQSNFDGYLLLLDVGTDGKITQIFPNPYSVAANADGRILAGSALTLPDKNFGFEFTASAPAGRGRLVAVVAKTKDVLSGMADAQKGFADLPKEHLNRLEAVLKPKLSVVPAPVVAASVPVSTPPAVTTVVAAAPVPSHTAVATPAPTVVAAAAPVPTQTVATPARPVVAPAANPVVHNPKPAPQPTVVSAPQGWDAGQRDYIIVER